MIASKVRRVVAFIVLLPLFAFWAGGCAPELLTGGIGFVLGRLTAPTSTTQTCTLNGVPVDCSAVN